MNDFGKEDFGRLENVFIGFWFETQKAKTTIHKASFKPCYTGGGAPWRCRTGLGGHLGGQIDKITQNIGFHAVFWRLSQTNNGTIYLTGKMGKS